LQGRLEDGIPSSLKLHNEVSIGTWVEKLSGAILKVLPATSFKSCARDDQRSLIPGRIQYEIRLKNQLRRQWHVTSDPALKVEVNRLLRSVTRQLNDWRNDQWSATLESLDPED
jgi:hypothetical protein